MTTDGIGSITGEALRALGGLAPTAPTQSMAGTGSRETSTADGIDFGAFLQNAISEVNELQQASTQATNDFILGRTDSIHEVMLLRKRHPWHSS